MSISSITVAKIVHRIEKSGPVSEAPNSPACLHSRSRTGLDAWEGKSG